MSIAVGISLVHGRATICFDVVFQYILGSRAVAHDGVDGMVKLVGSVIVSSPVIGVSIIIAQTEHGQQCSSLVTCGHTIKQGYICLAFFRLGCLIADVGNLEVGELHALNGVGSEGSFGGGVLFAGGDIGGQVNSVAGRGGQIVLVQGKGAGLRGINGDTRSERGEGERQQHNKCYQQRDRFFHFDFILSLLLFTPKPRQWRR